MITVTWLNLHEVDTRAGIDRLQGKLPDHYFTLAAQYIHEKDRFFYLAGKLLISHSFSLLCNDTIDWNKIHFPDQHQKPVYDGNFNFNISHAGTLIGCASSRVIETGLDIEQIKPIPSSVYEFALTKEELGLVRRDHQELKNFYQFWVLKESVLKLTGEGLTGDLLNFSFHNIQEKDVLLFYKKNPYYAKKITFHNNDDYLGCVATHQSQPVEVREMRFDELIQC